MFILDKKEFIKAIPEQKEPENERIKEKPDKNDKNEKKNEKTE